MAVTIEAAIQDLYRIAVTQRKATSTQRLDVLAKLCVQELGTRGFAGAQTNKEIQGWGRRKEWDVVWEHDGKPRLGISLKSLLRNLAGTVPNRIDDLIGEVANIQLHSPEIVLGYVMVLDIAEDEPSQKHGCTWSDLLRSRLQSLANRQPPSWTIGTIEAFVLVEVDFSRGARLVSGAEATGPFFDLLAEQVRFRNPST
jgi:hypothetical protein